MVVRRTVLVIAGGINWTVILMPHLRCKAPDWMNSAFLPGRIYYMKRFLVVDDDEMGRLMLQDFLSEFAPCDCAVNGREGLDFFERALAGGNPYDMLCVDLVMPEMNGLALIRKIRDIEKTHPFFSNSRTRIFVISASDSTWEKADLLLDNLCDDFITKPFNRDSLKADLYKYDLVNSY
jgi:two-component system chemotaxis response regulator CheY